MTQRTIIILIPFFLLINSACKNNSESNSSETNVADLIEINDSLTRLQIENLNTFLNKPINLQRFKEISETSEDYYWTSSTSNCTEYFKNKHGEIVCFDFIYASYDSTITYDKPLKIFGEITTIRIKKKNPNFKNYIDTTEILISLNCSKNLEYSSLGLIGKDTSYIQKLFGSYNQLNDSTLSYNNGEFDLELLHDKGLIYNINWERLK